MFRLKLTLLYFMMIVLVAVVSVMLIDAKRDEFVGGELLPSVKVATNSYEVLTQRRVDRLRAYLENLLSTDLPAYLRVLRENRDVIRTIGAQARQAAKANPEIREKVKEIMRLVELSGKDALDRIEAEVDATIKDKGKLGKKHARYVRELLASCTAEDEPWDVCFYKVIYFPLVETIFPKQNRTYGIELPQLFVLLESDGQTAHILLDNLPASVETLRTEDPLQAGQRYKEHRRKKFQLSAPVLAEVRDMQKDAMASSFYLLGEGRIFVVVASRITGVEGEFLGAVMAGYELDLNRARKDTHAVLGVSHALEQCLGMHGRTGGAAVPSDQVCADEIAHPEQGLTFVYQDRLGKTVVGASTADQQTEDFLSKNFVRVKEQPILQTADMVAQIVPFPLDFMPAGDSLHAVLSIDVQKATAVFFDMKLYLVLIAAVIFLLGLVVTWLLVRAHTKPFEEINGGIHEIISGNFDHSFRFDFSEELPRSMAQSLTIMKAVLLGLPLPEDQERDDSWAADLRVAGGEEFQVNAAEITDEEIAKIEEVAADQIKESATEYYRRLFREYVDARRGLGENVGNITYIKFVEKVAKTEKGLRERFGCKQVIFRVHVRDKQVALIPIKVVDKQ